MSNEFKLCFHKIIFTREFEIDHDFIILPLNYVEAYFRTEIELRISTSSMQCDRIEMNGPWQVSKKFSVKPKSMKSDQIFVTERIFLNLEDCLSVRKYEFTYRRKHYLKFKPIGKSV